ncbi:LPS-assembly protein LptD [Candidatus Kinetoplastidibacterium crithidiae]|uniref:LPS-assembly protein LptD n=1 Tax=Candidatus Kinetoplastidibacterium crithidiae TCC036E TaxID=1208918 RepID=M1L3T4_9PROT|nr:LPS assembly protein LptD [Candidatus Kinetoplastibacterium crithidii]AFZ83127.1 hypothetical protein CKCE_0715 [Candidatus Kinetoplastibacterium crithidii (ex Angomonas deanei ATCC 30255)]AGF47403.1 LPS-assembly protein [Candidatus Kinetoplastibacterium crithidii TCC036E]
MGFCKHESNFLVVDSTVLLAIKTVHNFLVFLIYILFSFYSGRVISLSLDETVAINFYRFSVCKHNQLYLNHPTIHTQSVLIEADNVVVDDTYLNLKSNAKISSNNNIFMGDLITINRLDHNLCIYGFSSILNKGNLFVGRNLFFDLKKYIGRLEDVKLWLEPNKSYIESSKVEFLTSSRIKLSNPIYSSCLCNKRTWYTKSDYIYLNLQKNEAISRNSFLYFYNVPILFFPYLSFPLNKESKSGFLFPTYGITSVDGLDISLPYYFSLSNRCDMTIAPRIMSKRGLMLESEVRYLYKDISGCFTGNYIHYDNLVHKHRWFYNWKSHIVISNAVNFNINLSRVSDADYFNDFDYIWSNKFSAKSLLQTCQLSLDANNFQGKIRFLKNQLLKELSNADLFDKLPEIAFCGNLDGYKKSNIKIYSNITNIRRVGTNRLSSLEADCATRLQIYPSISCNINKNEYYIKPKIGIHISRYWVNNALDVKQRIISRSLPILSLDGGASYYRNIFLFGQENKQIIEPKFFYLYVPYKNQSDIPCYDTFLLNFNFSRLFKENIYSGGWDRIPNANNVTFSITTKLLESNNSLERISFSVARIFFLKPRNIFIPSENLNNNYEKKILSSMRLLLADNLRLEGQIKYDYVNNRLGDLSVITNYFPSILKNVYLSYNYSLNKLDHRACLNKRQNNISLAFQWPINESFYSVCRFDYLLCFEKNNKTNFHKVSSEMIQSILGIEYKKDNCWVGRVVVHSKNNTKYNTALFLQIEFTGLGSLGLDPIKLLRKNIPGYHTTSYKNKLGDIFEIYK